MDKKIYEAIEQICLQHNVGDSVLEVGAIPRDKSLLCMNALKNVKEKIGINLNDPCTYQDFKIIQGNANSMDCFEDNKFDTVLCNAMLEHDKFFWKTIAEIHRVTKPGGIIIIGTPGFTNGDQTCQKIVNRLESANQKELNLIRGLRRSTITYKIHCHPHDYYRFTPQTFKEVFLQNLVNIKISSILIPPRIIGYGFKPY